MRKIKPNSRTSSRASGRGSGGVAGADARGTSLGAQLRAAMAEMEDVISGRVRPEERLTVHTVQLPDEPTDYGPRDVRAADRGERQRDGEHRPAAGAVARRGHRAAVHFH